MATRLLFSCVLACISSFSQGASEPTFLPFLNFTSPSPHIFHSLSNLLSVHPQTLFPNGHTIASVTVPRHTLLYHGRHDNEPVPSPEWLAFDIEMAYAIMGNMPESRMITYRTKKDIRAVYFDGASANLMGDGTWSQMVFLKNGTDGLKRPGWGRPPPHRHPDKGLPPQDGHEELRKAEDPPPRRPPGGHPPEHWNPLADEYFRARELCKWLVNSDLGGKGWGYEAIVRMNAGFELIWCDFDSPSLRVVSNLDASAPHVSNPSTFLPRESHSSSLQIPLHQSSQTRLGIRDEGPHGPGMSDPREPFRNTSNFLWFSAAAKRYMGDRRLRLDRAGVFSFYEPGLQNQSHVRAEEDTERLELSSDGRWNHKLWLSGSKRDNQLLQLRRRRRQHRLTSVDEQDARYMRDAVERRLRTSLEASFDVSKIDWSYVARDIVTLYSEELKTLLNYVADLPDLDGEQEAFKSWITKIRQLTHWFLLPFFEYPRPRPYDNDKLDKLFDLHSPLAQDTLQRCVSQYTSEDELLNEEDTILSTAITETLHGICSTVIKIGLHVEYHWFMYFQPSSSEPIRKLLPSVIITRARRWKQDLEELIAWLGWAEQDAGCKENCGIGEYCYVPMWPVNGWDRRGRWGEESEFLWEGVCVGMARYPPEQWESL